MVGDDASRFQVLALDGGGLKGVFTAAVLAKLEEDFKTRIIDHFDLIAGTSTGGLIALGLASGMSAREVLDFYLEHQHAIFPRRVFSGLRRAFQPYDPSALDEALCAAFGERTLGESPVRLVIPSFDLISNNVYLFRTPHLERLRRDYRARMVDVARATTAAPTFLPAHNLDGARLVDGGVWANNPTMCALVEANECAGGLAGVSVRNIGTTRDVKVRPRKLDKAGWARWSTHVVDLVLHGQALASFNHAALLLPAGNAVRLDVEVPAGRYRLDRIDDTELRGLAAVASRVHGPRVASFFQHCAEPYQRPGAGR